ncbi:MAG TPA: 2Fe-2S iron-sulfur cluster-binding protein [Holophaga sp.]|nr:2Fe-2S iron-sulfur cluster-binding protein [Holophaga sp.]
MERARVHFLAEDALAEVPLGTPLADVAEACGVDITFGCRAGSCGMCRVRIVSGGGHCSPMAAEERALLAELGAAPDVRLACLVKVEGDLGIDDLES